MASIITAVKTAKSAPAWEEVTTYATARHWKDKAATEKKAWCISEEVDTPRTEMGAGGGVQLTVEHKLSCWQIQGLTTH